MTAPISPATVDSMLFQHECRRTFSGNESLIHCRRTYGGIHVESLTKPKPEIRSIANAQDKERWKRDPIALAQRRSGVESDGGLAKLAVHPLAERKEISPKVNRLPKALIIARELIHFRSEIIWFTRSVFLPCSN
jgi:hypothetical protein